MTDDFGINEAQSIEELAETLRHLLNSGCIVIDGPSGEQTLGYTRVLVGRIKGLKLQIYSDEHAPPHFHVKSSDIDATFAIDNCEQLTGDVDGKTKKLIMYWHKHSRAKLVEIWNNTRPSDCPVGPINEND